MHKIAVITVMVGILTQGCQTLYHKREDKMSIPSDTAIGLGVLYCTEDPVTRCNDIYLTDVNSGASLNLTRGRIRGGFDGPWQPVGSPDGKAVIMRRNGGDHSGKTMMYSTVYMLEMDGLTIREVPSNFDMASTLKWAEDSESFCFTCKNSEGKRQVVIVNRATMATRVVAPDNSEVLKKYSKDSSTSHDGKYRVLATKDKGVRELWIESLLSDERIKVDFEGDCTCGVWAPDRALLAFWGKVGEDWNLMIVDHTGKQPKTRGKWSRRSGFLPPSWIKPLIIRIGPEAVPVILRVEAIPMSSSNKIDCGILYCAPDSGQKYNDLFLADPIRGTRMNLTHGRLKTGE